MKRPSPPLQPFTLITGASSGIGSELARLAAAEGRYLIVVARRLPRLKALAADLRRTYGVSVECIAHDLSKPGSAQALSDMLDDRGFEVDQLINNAGVGDSSAFADSDLATQQAMITLNISSVIELTYLLLPGMVERGSGRVMTVGSVASFIPGPYMSVYYASKAFVLSFSEALSEELRGSGVTVTCLCPGPTDTEFADVAKVSDDHPIKRASKTACDVASAGYRGMQRGKAIVITGRRMKIGVFTANRLLPRSWIRRLIGYMQK